MELPKGASVSLAPSEQKKIDDALAALAADVHAPRHINVTVRLHVHAEYPKSIVVGEDENGPITKTVNSAEEEAAALAAPEPVEE